MNKTPKCIVLLLIFAAVVVLFLACDENDGEDGVTGDEQYPGDSLKIQPPGIGVYLGAYDWMENGEKPGIEEFETAVGKKVALTGGGVCISAENQPFSIDVSCLQTKYDNGYTILTDISLRESDKIYLPQEIIDGQADHLLEDLAANLIAAGVPLFLAYPREPKVQPQWGFDGGGYGEDGDKLNTEVNDLYGAYGCADQQNPMCLDGPERYRDLCKYIHEAIEAKAPSRATWVMGAVIDRTPGWYEQVYPGNEYVDWHALDVYAWTESPTTIVSFSESVSPTWSEALSLDDKPIVITEFGVYGLYGGGGDDLPCSPDEPGVSVIDRSDWFIDFFDRIKSSHAGLGAFIYWQMGEDAFDCSNTRLRASDLEAEVWRSELQSNPNFWHSQI